MNKKIASFIVTLITVLLFMTACDSQANQAEESHESLCIEHEQKLEETTEEETNVEEAIEEESHSEEIIEQESHSEEISKEEVASQESSEKEIQLDFEFPDNTVILEVVKDYDGNQSFLTLKDEFLQYWTNQTMVCEKQIPAPAKISVGDGFFDKIGNPYISKDGDLVLIQSYTTLEGEKVLDYTILANNCIKTIPILYRYSDYVFLDCEGNYGVVFYHNEMLLNYPYRGIRFEDVDTANFILPQPTTIWLNESTVKSLNFTSWVQVSYGYTAIYGISVRLDVESYGELDIAYVCDTFEPVEVDKAFFKLLDEKFTPQEYDERFSKLIQTINEYK